MTAFTGSFLIGVSMRSLEKQPEQRSLAHRAVNLLQGKI
jgi:hypothetical protein